MRSFIGLLLPLLIGMSVLALEREAEAQIYRYVDANGVTHYSDSFASVPFEYRDQVTDITGEMDQIGAVNVVEGLNDPPAGAGDEFDPDVEFDEEAIGAEIAEGLIDSMGFGIVLIVLLAIPLFYLANAGILKLACRLAGADPPSFGRACGIIFVQGMAGSAVGAATVGMGLAFGIDETASIAESIVLNLSSFVLSIFVYAGILTAMMGYDFLKSLWAEVIQMVLAVVLVVGPILAIVAVLWL